MDHVFIKKEYPYNYNEKNHKIHLSEHGVFLHKQFASIWILFFILTVVVLFNRLHRVYAVWFQISDFAFYNELTFSTKTLAYLAYKTYKAFNAFLAFKRSLFNPFQITAQ